MSVKNYLGFKVHTDIRFYTPNTILIETEDCNITVSMVNEALDYLLGRLAAKTPMPDAYKKAKSVLQSLKKLFSNQKSSRPRKEDLKTTIEVLGELRKSMAKSDVEKKETERRIYICKMFIESLIRY